MYFSLKSDCYFRHYGSIGYILRPIILAEEVVDECGALFLEQLQYEPKAIDDIVSNLSRIFSDADIETLQRDALDFYMNLAEDGFLDYGESLQGFQKTGFEYSTLDGRLARRNFKPQLEESSSHFLGQWGILGNGGNSDPATPRER